MYYRNHHILVAHVAHVTCSMEERDMSMHKMPYRHIADPLSPSRGSARVVLSVHLFSTLVLGATRKGEHVTTILLRYCFTFHVN